MWVYILKRLLLMIPTLFGVLLLTFVVIQFVPGGPVDQYLAEARAGGGAGGYAFPMGEKSGRLVVDQLDRGRAAGGGPRPIAPRHGT